MQCFRQHHQHPKVTQIYMRACARHIAWPLPCLAKELNARARRVGNKRRACELDIPWAVEVHAATSQRRVAIPQVRDGRHLTREESHNLWCWANLLYGMLTS
jgi:hypothetical protein